MEWYCVKCGQMGESSALKSIVLCPSTGESILACPGCETDVHLVKPERVALAALDLLEALLKLKDFTSRHLAPDDAESMEAEEVPSLVEEALEKATGKGATL